MAMPNVRGQDLRDYLEALKNSHEFRVHAEVYDADEQLLERYDADQFPIIDGQVDCDLESDISRQLQLTLARTNEVSTDPTSPGSALSADRILKVIYSVRVPHEDEDDTWVDVDVFTGPISHIARDEMTVSVEAQSKEAYLLPPNRLKRSLIPDDDPTRKVTTEAGERTVTIVEDHKIKSYYAGDLIRALARRHGERRLRVPRTDRKLPEDRKLFDTARQQDGAWKVMQIIAQPQRLYFDGDGWLVLQKRRQRHASYVFSDGDEGEVLNVPAVDWDMSTFRNTVELRAFQKKQGNEKENPTLRVTVSLERSHPLSPHSLRRNGQNRELVETIETDHVYADTKQARHDADQMLTRIAHQSQTVTFTSIPIPHLEPGDLVALDVKGQRRVNFELKKFTLPLTPAAMSIGYTRKVRRK